MKSYEIISEEIYAYEPSISCGLAGGFVGVLGVTNSSLLVHGSSGCGFAMRYGLSQHWKSFIPCPVTSFHETDVVFGGNQLLERGIDKVEKIYSSDVLFVLTACSSEIIGDDMKEVVAREAEKRNKLIMAVEVGGATGNVFDGYNSFLSRIVTEFRERGLDCDDEGYVHPDTPQIDILGIIPLYDMFFRGDMAELRRIFNNLNLHVNSFFSGDCSVRTIKRLFKSDLAVSVCKNIGHKALQRLQRKSNVNTESFMVAPMGFKYTRDFFLRVAGRLNLDPRLVKKVLDKEEDEARKKMLRGFDFSKVMFGAGKAAIIGEPSRVLGLANFLSNEVGIRIVMIAFTSMVGQEELDELDKILKVKNNYARVLVNQDNYLIRKHLVESKVNLVFGRSIDRVKEMEKTVHITWQFPSTNRLAIYDRPYLGYNGVVSIIDDIVNGFSNIWY